MCTLSFGDNMDVLMEEEKISDVSPEFLALASGLYI